MPFVNSLCIFALSYRGICFCSLPCISLSVLLQCHKNCTARSCLSALHMQEAAPYDIACLSSHSFSSFLLHFPLFLLHSLLCICPLAAQRRTKIQYASDLNRFTAGRPFLRSGNPIPPPISCGNLGSPHLLWQPLLHSLILAALAPPTYSGSAACPLSLWQPLLPSLSHTLATLALFSLALTFQCPPRGWPQVQPLLEELLNLWSAGGESRLLLLSRCHFKLICFFVEHKIQSAFLAAFKSYDVPLLLPHPRHAPSSRLDNSPRLSLLCPLSRPLQGSLAKSALGCSVMTTACDLC